MISKLQMTEIYATSGIGPVICIAIPGHDIRWIFKGLDDTTRDIIDPKSCLIRINVFCVDDE